MAKKRPKKENSHAGNIAKAILPYAVAFIIVVVIAGGLASFLIYRVGVCFGVIAGGVTASLFGLLWLGATPYEKTSEDANDVEDGIILILLTGFANFGRQHSTNDYHSAWYYCHNYRHRRMDSGLCSSVQI